MLNWFLVEDGNRQPPEETTLTKRVEDFNRFISDHVNVNTSGRERLNR